MKIHRQLSFVELHGSFVGIYRFYMGNIVDSLGYCCSFYCCILVTLYIYGACHEYGSCSFKMAA